MFSADISGHGYSFRCLAFRMNAFKNANLNCEPRFRTLVSAVALESC